MNKLNFLHNIADRLRNKANYLNERYQNKNLKDNNPYKYFLTTVIIAIIFPMAFIILIIKLGLPSYFYNYIEGVNISENSAALLYFVIMIIIFIINYIIFHIICNFLLTDEIIKKVDVVTLFFDAVISGAFGFLISFFNAVDAPSIITDVINYFMSCFLYMLLFTTGYLLYKNYKWSKSNKKTHNVK